MEYPKLRAVEAFSVMQGGKQMVCLKDPTNLVVDMVLLSPQAFQMARMFDGKNSVLDIQAAFMRQSGSLIYSDDVKELIRKLDQAHVLEGPSLEQYKRDIVTEFEASSIRRSCMSGRSYPGDFDELEGVISSLFFSEDGPMGIPKIGEAERALKGAVLPHIDFERGGSCYGKGWREAARGCRARRFLIIGTGHFGLEQPIALTMKDFETPLGIARTDKAFVEALGARLGKEAFEGELAHRAEHSVEFQVLFIQFLFGGDVEIVPVVSVAREAPAWGDSGFISPLAAGFVEAARDLIADAPGETFVIASADLAHIGPRFGDEMEVSPGLAEESREKDLELLALLEKPDIEAFAEGVQADRNARHICGFMPILLAAAITEGKFELIEYTQSFDPMATVTFASMGIV